VGLYTCLNYQKSKSLFSAHAPYCHVRPVWMYHIFPRYLTNGTIFFWETCTEHKMCVLILSTTFVWNIYCCRRNSERYDKKYLLVFMSSALYPSQSLIRLDVSRHIFGKPSNIKFYENPSNGSRVITYVQTDGPTYRHDKANSSFSQFWECTYKLYIRRLFMISMDFNTNSDYFPLQQ